MDGYERNALDWLETAGVGPHDEAHSIARAQVHATLAVAHKLERLTDEVHSVASKLELGVIASEVTSEPGKWLLKEYARTPGDPKWHPGMGLESTIVAIEAEVRRQTVIEMENEGVVTWGDPRHRSRFLEQE